MDPEASPATDQPGKPSGEVSWMFRPSFVPPLAQRGSKPAVSVDTPSEKAAAR